jgi:hypothetical protein
VLAYPGQGRLGARASFIEIDPRGIRIKRHEDGRGRTTGWNLELDERRQQLEERRFESEKEIRDAEQNAKRVEQEVRRMLGLKDGGIDANHKSGQAS